MSAEKNIKEKENRILDSQRLQKEKLNSLQQQKKKFHNRKLSSSALLIISKNDSLQNIKKKVDLIIQHKPKKIREFRKVIREIDNNLEPSNHWEIFKKHFNQVHQGFFDRLKSTHTNLTQNDIRFCAYLKINLGSNEMSQLLNIQTNSVKKIKIRLKKKLNLLQEINLGKYINQI